MTVSRAFRDEEGVDPQNLADLGGEDCGNRNCGLDLQMIVTRGGTFGPCFRPMTGSQQKARSILTRNEPSAWHSG